MYSRHSTPTPRKGVPPAYLPRSGLLASCRHRVSRLFSRLLLSCKMKQQNGEERGIRSLGVIIVFEVSVLLSTMLLLLIRNYQFIQHLRGNLSRVAVSQMTCMEQKPITSFHCSNLTEISRTTLSPDAYIRQTLFLLLLSLFRNIHWWQRDGVIYTIIKRNRDWTKSEKHSGQQVIFRLISLLKDNFRFMEGFFCVNIVNNVNNIKILKIRGDSAGKFTFMEEGSVATCRTPCLQQVWAVWVYPSLQGQIYIYVTWKRRTEERQAVFDYGDIL